MAALSQFSKWFNKNAARRQPFNARSRWLRQLKLESLEQRDCPAGSVGLAAAAFTTPENVGTYTVNITRTGATPADLANSGTVDYAITDGTAILGADYSRLGTFNNPGQALSGTLTFPAVTDGITTSQTLTVSLNLVETRLQHAAPRTLNVSVTNVGGANGDTLGTSSAVVSITDSAPGLPVITAVAPSVSSNNVVVLVARQGGSFGVLNVPYTTVNGTAVAGTDYTATSGTLTWADGDTAAKQITIPVLSYATLSGSKTFSIDLGNTGLPAPSGFWSFDSDANMAKGIVTDLSGNGNNFYNVTNELGSTTRGSYKFGITPFDKLIDPATGAVINGVGAGATGSTGDSVRLISGTVRAIVQADLTGASWSDGGSPNAIAGISANSLTSVVTVTLGGNAASNPLSVGDAVQISGVNNQTNNTAVNITSISEDGSGLVTVTLDPATTFANPFVDGSDFVISGFSGADAPYNGTWQVTPGSITDDQDLTFTFTNPVLGLANLSSLTGKTAAGYYNGIVHVASVSGNQFTYKTAAGMPSYTFGGNIAKAYTITNIAEASGNTATVTVSGTNPFKLGESITLSNVSTSGYNGTYLVTGVSGNTFTITTSAAALGTPTTIPLNAANAYATINPFAIAAISRSGSTVSVTTAYPMALTAGKSVVISGVTPTAFNGVYVIGTVTDSTHFSYTDTNYDPTSGGGSAYQTNLATSTSLFAITQTGGTVTMYQGTASALTTGNTVNISGYTGGKSYLNGTYALTSAGNSQQLYSFQYLNPTSAQIGGSIASISEVGTTVTVQTTFPHGFSTGNTVMITGLDSAGELRGYYNGTYAITVVNSTTFTYTAPVSGMPARTNNGTVALVVSGGTASATSLPLNLTSISQSAGVVTVQFNNGASPTGTIHNYAVGDTVVINNATSSTSFSSSAVSEDGSGNVTVTTSAAHPYTVGTFVNISGFSNNAFNGTFKVTAVGGGGTQFTYSAPAALGAGTSAGTATIKGLFDGVYTIDSVPNANSFTYLDARALGSTTSGQVADTTSVNGTGGTAAVGTISFSTLTAANVQVGDVVRIGSSDVTNPGTGGETLLPISANSTNYSNVNYVVTAINSSNNFTAIASVSSGNTATSRIKPLSFVLNGGGTGGSLNGPVNGAPWNGPTTMLLGAATNGLNAPITPTDTTLYVKSNVGFPTTNLPFTALISNNQNPVLVRVTAVGSTIIDGNPVVTWTVDRQQVAVGAYNGGTSPPTVTTPSMRSANVPIVLVMNASNSPAGNEGSAGLGTAISGATGYQGLLAPWNAANPQPLQIGSFSQSGTTVTLNYPFATGGGPQFAVLPGHQIAITGVANNAYNGTWTVTAVNNGNLTFEAPASLGAAGSISSANFSIVGAANPDVTALGLDPRYYMAPQLNSLGTSGAYRTAFSGGFSGTPGGTGPTSTATSSGTLTYSFWVNMPVGNGALLQTVSTNDQRFTNNQIMLIGRSSDQSQGGSQQGTVQIAPYPGVSNNGDQRYTLQFRADNRPDGQNVLQPANVVFTTGQWNMFTLSWTPQGLLIYQNGEFKQNISNLGTFNPNASKQIIDAINGWFRINNVAQINVAMTQGGDVKIDDFAVWQQELTAAQIQAMYQKGIGNAWHNTATVTIGSATPSVTADVITTQPANASINVGGSANFSVATYNGVGPDTVQWQVSRDGGATYANISNGGVYSGATTSTLAINGSPTVAIQSVSHSGNTVTVTTSAAHNLTNGDTVLIRGTANNNVNGTYLVTVTGTNTFTYSTNVTATLSLGAGGSVADTLASYQYRAFVTNTSGNGPSTLTSNSATLAVDFVNAYYKINNNSFPTIQPSQGVLSVSSLNTNQSASLYAAPANPNGLDTLLWYQSVDGGYNFTPVATGSYLNSNQNVVNFPSLLFSNVQQANLGTYRSSATNTNGSVNSNNLTLTSSAISVTSQPTDQLLTVGNSATFTATATTVASPGDYVSWQQSTDGGATWTLYSGATLITNGTATLTLTNLTATQTGYKYRAAFANGTLLTNVATLVPAAVVTSVAPFVGPTSGGNVVIINGTGFINVGSVKVGPTNVTSFTVNSASQITVVMAAQGLNPSVNNVTVTNSVTTSATAGTADDYTYATPSVTSVVVNGGNIVARNIYNVAPALAGQQSVVEQLLVTFNQRVQLDANAFNISSLAASVTASVAIPSTEAVVVNSTPVLSTGNGTEGYTQYVLTFAAGNGVNSYNNGVSPGIGNTFTTIKDGVWQLNMTGAKVHAGLSDTATDAVASKFWALYSAVNSQDVTVSTSIGDGNSKLLSDGVALGEMYAAFGSFQNQAGPPFYNTAYDINLDGIVDGIDLGKMYANFGTIWTF